MSLQVWLPLNDSLVNNGISPLRFSAVSLYTMGVTSIGKIGSHSYVCDDHECGGIRSDVPIHLGNKVSMFCWVYMRSYTSAGSNLNGLISHHNYKYTSGFGLTLRSTGSAFYVSVSTGNGTAAQNCGTDRTYNHIHGATPFYINEWHHVGFTYDGQYIRIYLDGNAETICQKGTSTNSTVYANSEYNKNPCHRIGVFNWSDSYDSYCPKGCIQDARVYDHCLSQKEIEELAKGKVLHYKLSSNRAFTNSLKDADLYVYNNKGMPASITKTGETYQGSPVFRLTLTPSNSDHVSYLSSGLFGKGVNTGGCTFDGSTKYCYWMYYKPVSHSDISVGGVASNINYWTAIPSHYYRDGWYRVGQYRDGSISETKSDSIYTSFYVPSAAVNVPVSIDFCCPHLIRGASSIQEGDAYYHSTSTSSIEFDVSGNGNTGTIYGDVTKSSDTNRGLGSYSFTGSQYITAPRTAMVKDQITVNLWAYMSNWGTFSTAPTMRLASCTESGGWNFEPSSTGYVTFAIGTGESANAYKNATSSTTKWSSLSAGWHMFTGTYDGLNTKLYIDGQLNATNAAYTTKTPIFYNSKNCIFIGAEARGDTSPDTNYSFFTGKLSDFRIYGTALSASSILELYQSGGIIDDDCNIYSGDYIEENVTFQINKQRLTKEAAVHENTYMQTSDGAKFLRVFKHDVRDKEEWISSEADAKFRLSPYIESRLQDIPDLKGSDGNYEFILRYPEDTLPSGDYQELEYIRATGTQYIKTGIKGPNPLIWEHDIQFDVDSTRQLMGYVGTSGQYWGVQSADGCYGTTAGSGSIKAGSRDRIIFNLLQGQLIVNGSWGSSVGGAITSTDEYQIFALTGSYYCKANLYHCIAYDGNGTVYRNFIPCSRRSDGAVGLYDLITQTFYGNSGSGTFEKGPVRTRPPLCDKMYNRWKQSANPLVTASGTAADKMGYSAINICYQGENTWGAGMRQSPVSSAYLDCCTGKGGYWYGAIGQYCDWQISTNRYFPAPNGASKKCVELYIRIDNCPNYQKVNELISISKVPVEYEELEYLQATGTQYINTKCVVNNDTDRWEIGFEALDGIGNYFIAGAGWEESGKVWLYRYNAGNGLNMYITDTSGSQQTFLGEPGTPIKYYDVVYDAKKFYVNGNLKTTRTETFGSTPYTFKLFDARTDSNTYRSKARIYYFKLRSSGIPVKDMVPCRRKSDSVLGMYDRVSGEFHTNVGTGNFIAGPVKPTSLLIANQVIEG